MPRVSWSARAKRDLEVIVTDPAVRDQLRRNAEEILHDIPPRTHVADEGWEGWEDKIMWHRGVPHEHELPEQADGPENYYLFYRNGNPAPGYEALAVRSNPQVAGWYALDVTDVLTR